MEIMVKRASSVPITVVKTRRTNRNLCRDTLCIAQILNFTRFTLRRRRILGGVRQNRDADARDRRVEAT